MVDTPTPDPVLTSAPKPAATGSTPVVNAGESIDHRNPSVVSVVIAACGGAGLNLGRPHANGNSDAVVLNFDTSNTNSRAGERVHVLGSGNGSGSHRSENARDIEREVTGFTNEELGVADVAIVLFSLAGGSGSVLGPVMLREYSRRAGMRVIGVCIADASSATGAKNTINTLKTLTNISTNANLYLPLIVLSNDQPKDRRGVDEAANLLITDLVELLTKSVYEVDRNDRLNWIDPSKVVGAKPGLKLMQLVSDRSPTDSAIVIGNDSVEMVDSLLIIQNADEESLAGIPLPVSRLKKVGFYYENNRAIAGKVTGDIKAIDAIIDAVERMQQIDQSQRYDTVDRLNTSGSSGDLIL